MQRMKKIGMIGLALILLLTAGCAGQKTAEEAPQQTEDMPLNVYTTFYPLYAIADMLAEGGNIQLHCLVQPQDGCLRAYALSDWDLALLSGSADAVIAGGCGLESFETILYALGEDGPIVSAVFYDMELTEQKAVNTSEDTDSHWNDANPHIYMSIDGAKEIASRIAATFVLLDNENEAVYNENLESAQQKLQALQDELQAMLKDARKRRVIVMNEALVYAAEEYGLKVDLYYERESGADIEDYDLDACLNTLEASDARIVLLEKQAPSSLMEHLEEAGFIVVPMDTMSTRRADEGAEGYFEAQRANVRALCNAFAEAAERF